MERNKESFFKEYGCRNVLHIGGHLGQEGPLYASLGLNFTFVEPMPKQAQKMREQGYKVIQKAVSREAGEATFNIAHVSERSSLKIAPEDVMTVKDTLKVQKVTLSDIQEGFDGLAIDAQGETYDILQSGTLTFKVIICEASEVPRYKGEHSREEITNFLKRTGYKLIETHQHETLDIHDMIWIQEQ